MTSHPKIIDQLKSDAAQVSSQHELVLLKAKYLGKKSQLSKELASLSKLDPASRAKIGRELNIFKAKLLNEFEYLESALGSKTVLDPVDVTRPGLPPYKNAYSGHLHPSSLILKETYKVFGELGFAIVDSPEIETDWFNFEALNMPDIHPAREMQDTFYLKGSNQKLLPEHTHLVCRFAICKTIIRLLKL